MRRIGLIINSLGGGGAERVICTLANHWAETGAVEVHLLSLSGDRAAFDLNPKINVESIWATEEKSGITAAIYSRQAGRAIRSWRQRLGLDASVSFLQRANFANVLSHAGCPDGQSEIIISQRNVATHDYPANTLSGRLGRILIRRFYNRADRIICNSPGVVDSLAEIGVDSGRCSIIGNPQDIERIRQAGSRGPSRLWRSNSKPRLLVVGRLIRQKGYEVLLPALGRLARKLDFECLILGRGPLQGRLERLREALGLTQHVTFYGWDDNPFAAMNEADVFLLPSRWEGFGNVLVEAMALGKPVVAADCIGSPRWILDAGRHGLLFRSGDSEDFHAKLEELLLDPAAMESLGIRARERAGDFSVERMADQYLQALLPESGPARESSQNADKKVSENQPKKAETRL